MIATSWKLCVDALGMGLFLAGLRMAIRLDSPSVLRPIVGGVMSGVGLIVVMLIELVSAAQSK